MILSFVVAALLSTYFLQTVLNACKEKLKKRYAELKVQFKVGIRGISPPDDVTAHWLFLPLELPVELFQLFIPYRSIFFDAIKRCVYASCLALGLNTQHLDV